MQVIYRSCWILTFVVHLIKLDSTIQSLEEEVKKSIESQKIEDEVEEKKEEYSKALQSEGKHRFHIEGGKIKEGASNPREQVSYTNWYAGNVDPEELHRHKELLDRQHFRGPVWEGNPIPKSIVDDEEALLEYMDDIVNTPSDPNVNNEQLKSKTQAGFEEAQR